MSWLHTLLGHNRTAKPCEVTVTYCDGSTGTLHIWVTDAPDALIKGMDWIVEREDIGIRTILFEIRDRPLEM